MNLRYRALLTLLLLLLLPLAPAPESSGLQNLRAAERHFAAGEYTAAAAAYQQACRNLPASPYPAWGLAVLYERWGYPEQGLQALEEALTRGYTHEEPAANLWLALLAAAGDWEALESAASDLHAAHPTAPQPLNWLTQAQLQQLHCTAAAESAARWLNTAPHEAAAQLNWGALASFSTPSSATITALYQADVDLCQELRGCASPAVCDFQLGRALLRQGDPALAACVLQRAVAARPDAASGHAWLGAALEQLNRPADALPQLEAATELAPEDALGWLLLGMHELNYGSLALAREALLQAQRLDPHNPAPCLGMAALLTREGKYDQIKTWTDAALERAPHDPAIYHAVARFYLERNLQLAGAGMQAAAYAIQLAPEEAEGWLLQGWAYLNQGQVANALAALSQAIKLDPQLAEAYQLQGEAFTLLGQSAAAQAAFTRAADWGWQK
ncbi:MAG: tetratricopeptide repeat protein [Chloroflexota bacterium]|nr:tetratricopeptide repeat protein [Chloroflexota bacterium]